MAPTVVAFDAAEPGSVQLLGGKGDALVTMRGLGLPVPPGFVLGTDVCRRFLADGTLSGAVWLRAGRCLRDLEQELDRRLGDTERPLLLSVRSGAPVSMPGMMDTILNLGLNDQTVRALATLSGDAAFAWDSYSRLIRMYAITVRGMSGADFERVRLRVARDHDGQDLVDFHQTLTSSYLQAVEEGSGRPFPQDPLVQLQEACAAVFHSWDSSRAKRYRRYADLPDDLGTAVVVQAMVFGNLPGASGTGVAFTRDPATGSSGAYGDFLAHAQGEDVVAGEHDVGSLDDLRDLAPEAHAQLADVMGTLESHYRDMCDIEFTVEQGTLWILQTRVGKRTAAASVRIALDLVEEGTITVDEALRRIPARAMIEVERPVLGEFRDEDVIGRGTPASPGAAVGRLALTPVRAEELAAQGEDVILVRPYTSPDDIAGMIAARAVVTAHGGRTSHAAVVARGMDRPAVCGVAGLEVHGDRALFGDVRLEPGATISVDGGAGMVLSGPVDLVPPPEDDRRVDLLAACDARRRIPVAHEADEPSTWSDAAGPSSRELCRTPAEVEEAVTRGDVALVDPTETERPRELMSTAAQATRDGRVYVLVGADWPAQLERLPAGQWAGLVATDEGASAARLLAATVKTDDGESSS